MNLAEKIKKDFILNEIVEKYNNEVYLVGGAVRDFLLGGETYDRDLIVCDVDAREFALKLADDFNATFVPLDEVNKIYRLILEDKLNYLDITNPIDNSLESDLRRRDLTINAIAVNLKSGDVIDIVGGVGDLERKVIKMISRKNFLDDPLRLLRVFRFQASLGFVIEEETLEVVNELAQQIDKPAVERINYEIMKIFAGSYTDLALLNMDKVRLLEKLFPFIIDVKKVPQNTHHHLDLYNHSLETIRQIMFVYENSMHEVQKHMQKNDFGGFSRLAHLKFAGFLHDIGKFSTWTIEEDTKRHRFIKHDDVGAKMSIKMLKSMNFSNKQICYISNMIRNHIYPSQVMSGDDVSAKIMMRYIRKMDDSSIDNIILAKADRLSARGDAVSDDMVTRNINALSMLQDFYLEVKDTLEPLQKLLSGDDVMKILKIRPSRQLGEIMSRLHEAQLDGLVNSREQAMNFIINMRPLS